MKTGLKTWSKVTKAPRSRWYFLELSSSFSIAPWIPRWERSLCPQAARRGREPENVLSGCCAQCPKKTKMDGKQSKSHQFNNWWNNDHFQGHKKQPRSTPSWFSQLRQCHCLTSSPSYSGSAALAWGSSPFEWPARLKQNITVTESIA